MKKFYFLMMILLLSGFATAQQVSGTVADAKHDRPLSNVNVYLDDEISGARTDIAGYFLIRPAKSGSFTLRASLVGFLPYEKTIELAADEELTLEIYLQPVNIKLGDEVVITARRVESADFTSPEALTVLNQQYLENEMARSVPESMFGASGVFLQKTNHGGGSPFVRGLTGNQVLLMVDGVRLNNATFRYGPNQYLATVDPFLINRIEIVRGGGSVTHGSDAIGGVVQVFSKNPRFSSRGLKAGGNLYGKWMSDEMEYTGRAEVEVSDKNVAFLGGFTYSDYGDLVAGEGLGKESPTGYSAISGDGKLRIRVGRQNEFVMAYQYSRQDDVPRYDKIITGYEKYHFDPQIRQLGYFRFITKNKNRWFSQVAYTASYGLSDETRLLQKEGSAKLTTEQDVVDTWGANVEILSKTGDKWSFTSGVDFYYDRVGSSKTESQNGVDTEKRGYYPDGSASSSFALFTSHSYTLQKFIFSAGARVNAYKLKVEDPVFGDVDNSPVALVGNGSVAYKLTENHQVIGSVYSAFRAPNINDLSSFGSFNYGIEVPNPDLDPEKSLTAEIGLKSRWDKFSGSLFLYQTNLKDMIERVKSTWNGQDSIDGEKVYTKTNFASAVIKGVELNLRYEITPKWIANGNLTYTYGQNETLDEPMTRIPPLNGRLGIGFIDPSGFWASLDFLAAAKQDRLSSADENDTRIPEGGTPGWELFNLRMGYQWKFVTLTAGLNNIFNEAYRTHGSGVDGYGRSVWIGAKIGF